MLPRIPGLAHQLRTSYCLHTLPLPSCLPQIIAVRPTSSNFSFPFHVFLLQNFSGENEITLIYLLPDSNNYLCMMKFLRSITHHTLPTLYLTADSRHPVTSSNKHLTIWQELFVYFILFLNFGFFDT